MIVAPATISNVLPVPFTSELPCDTRSDTKTWVKVALPTGQDFNHRNLSGRKPRSECGSHPPFAQIPRPQSNGCLPTLRKPRPLGNTMSAWSILTLKKFCSSCPVSTAESPRSIAPLNESSAVKAPCTAPLPPDAPKAVDVNPPQRLFLITSTCALIVTASLKTSCGVKRSVVSTMVISSSLLSKPKALASWLDIALMNVPSWIERALKRMKLGNPPSDNSTA